MPSFGGVLIGSCVLSNALFGRVHGSLTPNHVSNSPNNVQTVLAPCTLPRKLSPRLWNDLKIDEFIRSYPKGQNLTVKDFAHQNGAFNFLCGIGEKCNAGELCFPVQGLAWYVLFATQEYNLYMNSLYKAVGTTMDLIRDTTASMIVDITRPARTHRKRQFWLEVFTLCGAVSLALAMGVFLNLGSLFVNSAWITLAITSGVITLGSNAGISGLTIASLLDQAKDKEERTSFENWSEFAFYFAQCEAHMHTGIANALNATLNSGISGTAPNSLANLLSNGTLLNSGRKQSLPELEAKMKDVTQIRALVVLLRSMNAFVTRGSEPCNGGGMNGARDEKDHLSFCGRDNVMMNIVLAEGNKVVNEIYSANTITVKYSITTEYLTQNSWECQKKYGLNADPYQNSALPPSPTADCVANLAVCDCTRKDIAAEIKRSNIVKACRNVGKLNI